jgi:hypothetical protein
MAGREELGVLIADIKVIGNIKLLKKVLVSLVTGIRQSLQCKKLSIYLKKFDETTVARNLKCP